MSEPKQGLLIDDDEIRKIIPGDEAEIVIDQLDRDPKTQKYEAIYHGKRHRPNVEAWLKANGHM